MSEEYEIEAAPGLPAPLPEGERVLWRGAPEWRALARRLFHTRIVAWYFAALLAMRGVIAAMQGATPAEALAAALWLAPVAFAGLGVMALLAWLIARSTVYTVTNRRVVMRFGVALPMTVNVPFAIVEAAALKLNDGETGDIALSLAGPDKLAYLNLWPHVRPWRFRRPEPMLRSVPQAESVAGILSRALRDAKGGESPAIAASAPANDARNRAKAAQARGGRGAAAVA